MSYISQKFPFVSRIEFILSKLPNFSVHVTEITVYRAPANTIPDIDDDVCWAANAENLCSPGVEN